MYLVEIDSSHNRLHIKLMQAFDEVQAEALLRELECCVGELQRGFYVVTDLTELVTMESSSIPCVKRAMALCNTHGVGKVVRIIPDPLENFGLTVMSYFHYAHDVPVVTCSSLEEALEHLSQE